MMLKATTNLDSIETVLIKRDLTLTVSMLVVMTVKDSISKVITKMAVTVMD